MPFDVEGARRAGYSDAEIADHLARQVKFDAPKARQSGYSDAEIVRHLSDKAAQAERGKGLLAKAGDAITNAVAAPFGADMATAARVIANPAMAATSFAVDRLAGSARSGTFASDAAKDEGYVDRAGSLLERGSANVVAGLHSTVAGLTGSRRARAEADNLNKGTVNQKVAGQTTWQDAKDRPGIDTLGKYVLDASTESLPGMAVAVIPVAGLGTYAASSAGNIADQRAQNDGRSEASAGDVFAAAPAAIASAYLERVGARIAATIPSKSIASGIGRAALAEAGTEALQSSVEYAGGTLGTQKGFSAAEMGDQALAGAVAGAGMGGAIRVGADGYRGVVRLGGRFNQRPIAPGLRAEASQAAATPTPEDIASPIPTDLIMAGKVDVADAGAKSAADDILAAAGMPATGTRVSVTMPDGQTHTGFVRDAFHTDAGEMGSASGIAINMDDGTIFTDHFDTLAEAGVKIHEAPAFEQSAEAKAIDAQLAEQAAAAVAAPTATAPTALGLNTHTRNADDRQGSDGFDLSRYMGRSRHAESGGSDAAKAVTSSAYGRYQFLKGTWLATYKQTFGETGESVDAILAKRADGAVQDKVMATFTNNNAAALRRAGVPVNDGSVYLAHFLGVGDAIKVLKAAPGTDIDGIVSHSSIAANAAVFSKTPTAGALTNWASQKMGSAPVGGSSTSSAEAFDPNTRNSDRSVLDSNTGSSSYLDQAMRRVVGDPIDSEWSKFSDTSGTLAVPRDDMPQIKAEHRGAMVNFLNARGISHDEQTVLASDLKPTQAEFSNAKVRKAIDYEGGNRAILTSSDGYVLDGHHQWMAALSKGEDVRTIRLGAPIAELLKVVPEFPSATDAQGSTDTKPVEIPADQDTTHNGALKQGLVDYNAGYNEGDNPHPQGSREADEWENGWHQGANMRSVESVAFIRGETDTRPAPRPTPPPRNAKAPASTARVEPTPSGKGVAVIGASQSPATPKPQETAPNVAAKGQESSTSLTPAEQSELARLRADNANGDMMDDAATERYIELAAKAKRSAEAAKVSETQMTRDQIAQSLADKLGSERRDFHNKLADAILGKNFWGLMGYLQPINKKSRAVFSEATGIKLPTTAAGTKESLREYAGISKEEIARVEAEGKASAAEKRKNSEREYARSDAAQVMVSAEGQRMTGADWVDGRIAEGFDRLVNMSNGPVPRYGLANAEGRGYPIKKELLAYAKFVTKAGPATGGEDIAAPRMSEEERKASDAAEGVTADDSQASEYLFADAKERLPIARKQGAQAWGNNDPRVLPGYLNSFPVEVGQAWYEGWDKANLAAPVPASDGIDRADTLAVVDANNQTRFPKHSNAERTAFRLGAAEALGTDSREGGDKARIAADWPDAFQRGKDAGRAELRKRRNANGGALDDADMSLMLDLAAKERSSNQDKPVQSTTAEPLSNPQELTIAPTLAGGMDVETAAKVAKARDQESKPDQIAKPAEKVDSAATKATSAPEPSSKAGQFANNKLVPADKVEAAHARLKDSMNRLNSGIDPEILIDGMTIAAAYIESGVRNFAVFAKAMRDDFSNKITPYLLSFWEGARAYPGLDTTGMTPQDASRAMHDMLIAGMDQEVATQTAESATPPTETENAGTAIYPNGAGSLETVASDNVPGSASQRTTERAGATGQQGSGGTDREADGAGLPEARGRGSRAAGPDQGVTGGGRRVKPAPAPTPGETVLADPSRAIEQASPINSPFIDFTIDDSLELGKGTEGQKYQDNLAAIRTLKMLESENRRASPDEQRTLARYVGWGGLKNAFRVAGAKDGEGVAKGWEKRVAELEELLTPAEIKAARNSTTAAHFTSQTVVEAMWKAVERLGFQGGAVLEPSVGTGNFLGLMPQSLRGVAPAFAVEYDSLTARIAQRLYPNATVIHSGFQEIPIPQNQFALAIGNPPFGRESLYFPHNAELNGKSIHNQFFIGSLDAVAEGGIMAMVVSHNLMDALDASSRLTMAARGRFIGGIRLPDTAFKENARTEVVTDILFFQKRSAGDAKVATWAAHELRTGSIHKEADIDGSQYHSIRDEMQMWTQSSSITDPAGSGEMINANGYFLRNSDMVIGTINATGTMNVRADLNVTLDDPAQFKPLLDAAIEKLPRLPARPGIAERTTEHFKVMADAMRLSAKQSEIGAVSRDLDGKLKMVIDLDGGEMGKSLLREIELTEDTPFNPEYDYTVGGKWQRTIDVIGENGKPVKVMDGDKATNRNEKQTIAFDNTADIPASHKWGKERIAIVGGLLPIRDAIKKQLVLESQGATDGMIDLNRKALNKTYDQFVKKFGNLHSAKVIKIAMLMPDGALALAAEANIGDKKSPRYGKADIMSKRVTAPPKHVERAEDARDAIAITLGEVGRIDIDRVAALLDTDVAGAEKALSSGEQAAAFYDPETGRWEPRDLYLSGLVRRKLHAAMAAGLDANIAALEEVIPKDWEADQITPTIGSAWIPAAVYADFLKYVGYTKSHVSYSAVTNSFTVSYDGKPAPQWATSDAAHSTGAIIGKLLNSQSMKVTRTDRDNKVYVDEVATAETQQKASELFNEFLDWAYADEARRTELLRIFNEKYNTRLVRQRDGSHLKLFGKVPDAVIKMRRHQMNGIWRGITDPAVLYDHVVGAGKTFTAIARIMERRRMGLSSKPMVVVPNHLVEQWAHDAKQLYPGANIMAAGKTDFERKSRRRLFARIGSSDFDMVIIGHSSFSFIDLDRATEERYLNDELTAAMDGVEEAKAAAAESGEGGWHKPFGVAEAERLVTKLTDRLAKLRTAKRDRLLTFEEMGIDDLTIDEAHEFKNLAYSSRLQGVSGMGNKTGSQKAMDLHLKVRSLRDRTGTSVAFLTGTPISNSVAEMYLILRNLVPNEMKEMGIENFDAWRSMFVSYASAYEPTEAGGVKEVTRLGREWTNMKSLMDLYYSVSDAVTNEDIKAAYTEDNPGKKFPIPEVASARRGEGDRAMVAVKPTPETRRMLADVVAGFEGLPGITDPKERNATRLRLMDKARKVSLDPRAVDPYTTVSGEGGKIRAVVDNVTRVYHKWQADKGTQIIFLDRSVPKAKGDEKIVEAYDGLRDKLTAAVANGDERTEAKLLDDLAKYNSDEIESLRAAVTGGWNAYDEIKRQLVDQGIPEAEIRFVQEASTDKQKQDLFELVKTGAVRVLLGSTPRMGAGTNVQDRLVALHHVDVTWKPSDIEQREGRIIRQGNQLLEKYGDDFEVEIMAYATEMTVDAKMWSLNATKLKAINGIRKYDGSFLMEFEDEESASMAEMAALATGNPLMVERVTLNGDIQKLEIQQRSFKNRSNGLRDKIKRNKRQIKQGPGRAQRYEDFANHVEESLAKVKSEAAQRSITVEGKPYSSRMDAEEAAQQAIEAIRAGDPKARFSIEVGGEKVTTKEQITEAIRAALGNADFAATVGGTAYISLNDTAKAIANLAVGRIGEFTLDKITINGVAVEIDVTSARFGVITMAALNSKGAALIDFQATGENLTISNTRALIDKMVSRGLDPARFQSAARIELRQTEDAQKEQDSLEVEVTKPWPKEAELEEKRSRLQDVIKTLSEQKIADTIASSLNEDGPKYGVADDSVDAYSRGDAKAEPQSESDASPADVRNNDVPLRGRGETRALGIADQIRTGETAALVGALVAHPSELAELAQVYRDPRHETFRVFFTKGNNVVHATGVSSRQSDETPLLPNSDDPSEFHDWLAETMASAGADGFYLLHNHPSGDPTPSPADKKVTAAVAGKVPGFKGHVVINSNKYAVIDARGDGKTFNLDLGDDALLKPSKPHPVLGEVVLNADALARMGKAVQRDGYVTIVGTNRGKVRVVVDYPVEHLSRASIILMGALRRIQRMSGASALFIIGERSVIDNEQVHSAYAKGLLTEGIDTAGRFLSQTAPNPPPKGGSALPKAYTGSGRFVAEDGPIYGSEAARFDDAETESRFQAARAGVATTQTLRERVSETWEKAWNGISRHWIALPNEPRYAALQEKLRGIESAPQAARERTVAMLDDMVKDFTNDDLDLFTRKVILDDLSWDAANERDLPFGFTVETLTREKAKVDGLVMAQPDQKVWKAAMKRKLANRKVAQELVDAGVLEAEQIKNPSYYRHQVLEYARAQMQYAKTPGKKLRTPKWAKRMGSTLDINANLLEAEFDWLNKAFVDIPVAETIEWIKKSEHNILEDLKAEAKSGNQSGVDAKLAEAEDVLDDSQSSDDEKMQAQSLIDQARDFRKSIAIGFGHIRAAIDDGSLDDMPAKFRKAAEAIQTGDTAGDPPFALLSWMLDTDQPGAMGAAMILKAIGQRRAWTKNLLGRDYVEPDNAEELVKRLAPDGYRTWQPDEGKLLFTVKTLPEHVIDGMLDKLDAPEGIDPAVFRAALEGSRNMLAVGGQRYTMILPEEVADTLSMLRREEVEGLFEHFVKEPVRLWKRWVLVNPRRFLKYNLNNVTGDLDAVLAGNPKLLRHVGKAGRELADVMRGKARPSDRYQEAVARGVFDSGLSIQEIPDINQLAPFERFAEKKGKLDKYAAMPLRKAWNALQGSTQWRENVFRYAAYLDYADRLEGGESQSSVGYGASRPNMVDAVPDLKDRAALLSRDLLGDYGAISHYGSSLRQTVIPFWSWMEINTRRYWRLTGNAYSQGVGKGIAVGGGMAISAGARTTAYLAIRMALVYGMLSLWNGLFFPDEEDELGEAQRQQMHLILGRNDNGEIITMRTQGAMSDALSWFGLSAIGKAAHDYELGRGSLWSILSAAPKAAINKVATAVSPIITVPVEAATGKKIWPDVFNTRSNRDPWRNVFSTVSLENEYDLAMGKPSRGYARSWQEAAIYRKDPGEIAYNEARGVAYDWLKREKGQEFAGGFTSKRSEAARDYRTALKFGDQESADKSLNEMIALGVDSGDFSAMVKRAAPLGPIAKKDRQAFIDQLTPDEYQTFQRAQRWYDETFLSTAGH